MAIIAWRQAIKSLQLCTCAHVWPLCCTQPAKIDSLTNVRRFTTVFHKATVKRVNEESLTFLHQLTGFKIKLLSYQRSRDLTARRARIWPSRYHSFSASLLVRSDRGAHHDQAVRVTNRTDQRISRQNRYGCMNEQNGRAQAQREKQKQAQKQNSRLTFITRPMSPSWTSSYVLQHRTIIPTWMLSRTYLA